VKVTGFSSRLQVHDESMCATLRLLGPPRIVDDGVERVLSVSKPACLLQYLAVRGDWVTRDELTLLFWPDSEESSARHALRQLIYRARALGWAPGLEVVEAALRWLADSDVRRMRAALAAGDWPGAVLEYGGPFLEGVAASDAPGFEAWRDVERDELHALYLDAALKAAASLELGRDYRGATAMLRQALRVDPLAEPLVQALLRCLALSGEAAAAQAVFERFARDLDEQVGGEPDATTAALLARIRSGRQLDARPHNLPRQTTPFVGRERELREIARLLRRRDCRLLTVVGPGGIGKSRLALQAAADQIGAYPNGVFQVSLAAVGDASGLPTAMAEALRLGAVTPGEPWARLAGILGERAMLVLLDGVEHARGVAQRLVELLARAPGLTLLATSREALDVASEWVYPLSGLELPLASDAEASQAGSVRLFVSVAQQLSPGFSLRDGHAAGVSRVCTLVAGVPLAIELAAAWTPLLAPSDIAREIERDLDFLQPSGRRGGGRRQDLRSLFEATWGRLADDQRACLVRAAVFAGDADAAALVAVTGATLHDLLALVKRSLFRRTDDGRFTMHELVRQYVRERLAATPGVAEQVVLRHMAHYVDVVARWSLAEDGAAVLACLEREQAEIRLAWGNAVRRGRWDAVSAMATKLSLAHDFGAKSERYLLWLDDALAALGDDDRDPTLVGRLLAQRAGCLHRIGRYAETAQDVAGSLQRLDGQAPVLERCVALRVGGNVAYLQGDLAAAEASFLEALRVAEALGDHALVAGCLNNLGVVAKAKGALDQALVRLEAARSVAERHDDGICSQVLNNLAAVHARRGERDRAEAFLLESVDIKQRLGDERGLASNYTNLGNLRARAGDRAEAERYHRESMRFAEAVGDRSGVARAHANLGDLALAESDIEVAERHYARALALKRVLGERAGVFEAYAQLVACHLCGGAADAAACCAIEGLEHALTLADPASARPLIDACATLVSGDALAATLADRLRRLGEAIGSRSVAGSA
jgi:predicted ATPase/DNA-binding SARP family transcriptional activator